MCLKFISTTKHKININKYELDGTWSRKMLIKLIKEHKSIQSYLVYQKSFSTYEAYKQKNLNSLTDKTLMFDLKLLHSKKKRKIILLAHLINDIK